MWKMKAVISDYDHGPVTYLDAEFFEFGDFLDLCTYLNDVYYFKSLTLTRIPLEVQDEH